VAEPRRDEAPAFPAPVRGEGYARWTWSLFRGSCATLAPVFVGGVVLVRLIHLGVILLLTETLDAADTVGALAVSLAAGVLLATVAGSILSGLASFVFLGRLGGAPANASAGWARLRPKLGHVVVGALYVAMPLLALLLFLGPVVQYVLLPAVLGPPVLAGAIVWEHRDFRGAATRTKNLLAGSWGRVISTLVLVALGAAVVQIVFLALVTQVLPREGSLASSLWMLVFEVLTTGTVWLLTAAASSVAYLELRARFEDLDREALAAEAGALPAAG
jgi:hypothetical protein